MSRFKKIAKWALVAISILLLFGVAYALDELLLGIESPLSRRRPGEVMHFPFLLAILLFYAAVAWAIYKHWKLGRK